MSPCALLLVGTLAAMYCNGFGCIHDIIIVSFHPSLLPDVHQEIAVLNHVALQLNEHGHYHRHLSCLCLSCCEKRRIRISLFVSWSNCVRLKKSKIVWLYILSKIHKTKAEQSRSCTKVKYTTVFSGQWCQSPGRVGFLAAVESWWSTDPNTVIIQSGQLLHIDFFPSLINKAPFLTYTGPCPASYGLSVGEEAEKQQPGGNHHQHPLWRVGPQGWEKLGGAEDRGKGWRASVAVGYRGVVYLLSVSWSDVWLCVSRQRSRSRNRLVLWIPVKGLHPPGRWPVSPAL